MFPAPPPERHRPKYPPLAVAVFSVGLMVLASLAMLALAAVGTVVWGHAGT